MFIFELFGVAFLIAESLFTTKEDFCSVLFCPLKDDVENIERDLELLLLLEFLEDLYVEEIVLLFEFEKGENDKLLLDMLKVPLLNASALLIIGVTFCVEEITDDAFWEMAENAAAAILALAWAFKKI